MPASEAPDGCALQLPCADSQVASGSHYKQEHKDFIVLRQLELQLKFDNKRHKNDQLWDDLMQEFIEKFPGQGHSSKNSIKDQFNQPQKSFCDYCKTKRTFASGQVSGLCRNEQEHILESKMSSTHSIFLQLHESQTAADQHEIAAQVLEGPALSVSPLSQEKTCAAVAEDNTTSCSSDNKTGSPDPMSGSDTLLNRSTRLGSAT
jgi:hypothetical protein